MEYKNIEAVVFAAGQGKRMESDIPKVLHPINGTPMILLTLKKLQDLEINNIVIVVGYKAKEVKKVIIEEFPNYCHPERSEGYKSGIISFAEAQDDRVIKFAYQEKQVGTANSLEVALPLLNPETENILVLNGDDSAFYSLETLKDFLASHLKGVNLKISAMTIIKPEAASVGRVIRDAKGKFEKILELNEYQESGLSSDEVNCGAYIFDRSWVERNIDKVSESSKGEFYITELLNIAKNDGINVNLYELKNPNEWHGINTKEDLNKANNMSS